jgi:hypothetical protein
MGNAFSAANAKATGGREGHVETNDGVSSVNLAIPKEMGGAGGAKTNRWSPSNDVTAIIQERQDGEYPIHSGVARPLRLADTKASRPHPCRCAGRE